MVSLGDTLQQMDQPLERCLHGSLRDSLRFARFAILLKPAISFQQLDVRSPPSELPLHVHTFLCNALSFDKYGKERGWVYFVDALRVSSQPSLWESPEDSLAQRTRFSGLVAILSYLIDVPNLRYLHDRHSSEDILVSKDDGEGAALMGEKETLLRPEGPDADAEHRGIGVGVRVRELGPTEMSLVGTGDPGLIVLDRGVMVLDPGATTLLEASGG
ncbi:hypothetical protein JB92DRAFT_2838223 [Gautieria morchelliformis]|nr:hypothetical protein JB92DRAFT_2838223 [Gautieria morchelliformis]